VDNNQKNLDFLAIYHKKERFRVFLQDFLDFLVLPPLFLTIPLGKVAGLGMELAAGLDMELAAGLDMELAAGLGMELAAGLGMELAAGLGILYRLPRRILQTV
jgi:hypothetical protein